MKRCKAHGSDMLLNEYFIECIDILAPFICDIFNAVLNSGCYPEDWFNGIIVPLYKKGDKKSVDNYRGITLLSCLSKLFTSVLNGRIEKFCEKKNLFQMLSLVLERASQLLILKSVLTVFTAIVCG